MNISFGEATVQPTTILLNKTSHFPNSDVAKAAKTALGRECKRSSIWRQPLQLTFGENVFFSGGDEEDGEDAMIFISLGISSMARNWWEFLQNPHCKTLNKT